MKFLQHLFEISRLSGKVKEIRKDGMILVHCPDAPSHLQDQWINRGFHGFSWEPKVGEKVRLDYIHGKSYGSWVPQKLKEEKHDDIYWVVKNTRTGEVRSVMPPDMEKRAWDLADRLQKIGRKDHHIVTAGSREDYDKFYRGRERAPAYKPQFTNARSVVRHIAEKLGVPYGGVYAILVGGDDSSAKKALDVMIKDGFDDGGGWVENQKWFKKHGVNKAAYELLIKAGE